MDFIIPRLCRDETIEDAPVRTESGKIGRFFKNPEKVGSGRRTLLASRTPLLDIIGKCPFIELSKNADSIRLDTSGDGVDE